MPFTYSPDGDGTYVETIGFSPCIGEREARVIFHPTSESDRPNLGDDEVPPPFEVPIVDEGVKTFVSKDGVADINRETEVYFPAYWEGTGKSVHVEKYLDPSPDGYSEANLRAQVQFMTPQGWRTFHYGFVRRIGASSEAGKMRLWIGDLAELMDNTRANIEILEGDGLDEVYRQVRNKFLTRRSLFNDDLTKLQAKKLNHKYIEDIEDGYWETWSEASLLGGWDTPDKFFYANKHSLADVLDWACKKTDGFWQFEYDDNEEEVILGYEQRDDDETLERTKFAASNLQKEGDEKHIKVYENDALNDLRPINTLAVNGEDNGNGKFPYVKVQHDRLYQMFGELSAPEESIDSTSLHEAEEVARSLIKEKITGASGGEMLVGQSPDMSPHATIRAPPYCEGVVKRMNGFLTSTKGIVNRGDSSTTSSEFDYLDKGVSLSEFLNFQWTDDYGEFDVPDKYRTDDDTVHLIPFTDPESGKDYHIFLSTADFVVRNFSIHREELSKKLYREGNHDEFAHVYAHSGSRIEVDYLNDGRVFGFAIEDLFTRSAEQLDLECTNPVRLWTGENEFIDFENLDTSGWNDFYPIAFNYDYTLGNRESEYIEDSFEGGENGGNWTFYEGSLRDLRTYTDEGWLNYADFTNNSLMVTVGDNKGEIRHHTAQTSTGRYSSVAATTTTDNGIKVGNYSTAIDSDSGVPDDIEFGVASGITEGVYIAAEKTGTNGDLTVYSFDLSEDDVWATREEVVVQGSEAIDASFIDSGVSAVLTDEGVFWITKESGGHGISVDSSYTEFENLPVRLAEVSTTSVAVSVETDNSRKISVLSHDGTALGKEGEYNPESVDLRLIRNPDRDGHVYYLTSDGSLMQDERELAYGSDLKVAANEDAFAFRQRRGDMFALYGNGRTWLYDDVPLEEPESDSIISGERKQPLGRWAFNGDFTDEVRNNDGTSNRNTDFVSNSVEGQSLKLSPDGVATIPHAAEHTPLFNPNGTVSFWVKFDGFPESSTTLMSKLKDGNGWEVRLTNYNELQFVTVDDGQRLEQEIFPMDTDTWYFLCFSKTDTGILTAYYGEKDPDGGIVEKVLSSNLDETHANNADTELMRASYEGMNYDELRFFGEGLTEEQALDLFNNPTAMFTSNDIDLMKYEVNSVVHDVPSTRQPTTRINVSPLVNQFSVLPVARTEKKIQQDSTE